MKKRLLAFLFFLGCVTAPSLFAVNYVVTEHYTGATSGTGVSGVLWSPVTPSTVWTFDSSSPAGWTSSTVINPNNNTANPSNGTQIATQLDVTVAPTLTGNLDFTTSGAVNVQNFALTPNVTSGIMTFKLGGNFSQFVTSGTLSSITGATSDASKLVIDLNGYNFTLGRGTTGNSAAGSFTLNSTVAGGIFTTSVALTDSVAAARIAINDGATLYTGVQQGVSANVAAFYTFNTAMTANSTLHLATSRTTGSSLVTHSSIGGSLNQDFGNLILGDGSTASIFSFSASWTGGSVTPLGRLATVRGDFTIAQNSTISIGTQGSTTGISGLAVGGNYSDVNTGSRTYSPSSSAFPNVNSIIFFNGGYTPATPLLNERTVTIGGTITKNATSNLTSSFQVGDGTTGGNIKLGANLTTTDTVFLVTNNSRLNLANSILSSAGGITVNAGGTIADNFGTITSGLATTSGALTLNSFNLQLNFDGSSWTTGTITLFSYGSLIGTPSLNSLTLTPGYTAGTLSVGGGLVQITVTANAVPEPGTAILLMGAFGGLVVWATRRKPHRI